MLKKGLSIILSVVMLIALYPAMTVFGALPTDKLVVDTSNNVTTEGSWTDDFSQHTKETTEAFSYYQQGSKNIYSDLFDSGSGVAVFNIIDTDPSEAVTNMALKIDSSSTAIKLSPKTVALASGQVLRWSYDVCFSGLETGTVDLTGTNGHIVARLSDSQWGGRLYIVGRSSGDKTVYKLNHYNGDQCDVEQDKWYRVVTYYFKDTGKTNVSFIDAETGECYFNGEYTSSWDPNAYYSFANVRNKFGGYTLIDNAELMVYSAKSYSPSVSGKSIEDTGVATDIEEIEVTFDQPIATVPSSVNLTADGIETVTATVSKVSTKHNTYKLEISDILEGSTVYTADLSGFINSGSKNAGNFTFTTAAAAPVVLSSTPANGATDVSVETNSATVTFDQAMTEYPATLNLAGGIVATVSTSDNKTFTLNWTGELEGDTTYSISLAEFKNADGKSSSKEAVAFKTEYTGIVKLEDKFEDTSKVQIRTWGFWYDAKELLYLNRESAPGNDVAPLSLTDDGYNGKALSLKTGSQDDYYLPNLRTNDKYSLESGEKLVATWRFNLKDMATVDATNNKSGSEIYIGCSNSSTANFGSAITMIRTVDGKPVIGHRNFPEIYSPIEENHWYNVYLVVESGKQTIYFVDAEGESKGKLVYSREKLPGVSNETDPPALDASSASYIHLAYGRRYTEESMIYNDSQEFLIDDFTLWHVNTKSKHHALSLDGDLTGTDGNYSMTFNQPVIGTEAMLKVAEVTGSAPAEYNYDVDFAAAFTYPDFCTQTVSLSKLPYKTNCVLDYSGLKGVVGTAFNETVSCLTEPFTTGLDSVGTITLAGTAKQDASNISFKLYNDGASAETPRVFVAFYNEGALSGVAEPEQPVSVPTKGETTVLVSAADYNDFDSVKIFVWNDNLVPLMSMYDRTIISAE